ncbi:membrane hypothetical protein [metagenome]|uniref:Uncharacterized protein n=1 Tax=metagenome TaxID=256318 RepID=A0A2P2BYP5_9ZZZZ
MNRLLDPFAAASAALSLVMVATYLAVIDAQDGDGAAAWVLVALLLGAGLAAYGAVRSAPLRPVALGVAVGVLGLLGLVAILSIGLPILAASGLALTALIRSASRPAVAA